MSNSYSTQKIIHHPELLERLKNREQGYPIQIHFMPQNICNQNCSFCSYRLENYKNSEMFDDSESIPLDKMLQIMDDAKEMGVKAFEVTGGGEPLLYKHREIMFDKMIEYEFDIALVTNGTALSEALAKQIGEHLTWCRVSIDSGSAETYSLVRDVDKKQFYKALRAIALLREYCTKEGASVGAGFVVNNENYEEIYDAVKLVKEAGAMNIRIASAYTGTGVDFYNEGVIGKASELARLAKEELEEEDFTVYNLFNERIGNLHSLVQDYSFCGTKELLCVIGGDQNVYTCCSLAFNKNGLIGSIKDQSFKELYDSVAKERFYDRHDPRRQCRIPCLYEKRNHFINYALEENPSHINFI